MAEPLLALYDAYTAAVNELAATEARIAAELTAARGNVAEAKASLFASMPEGVEFATTADHPPVVKREGDAVVVVPHPFLGHPYPAPEA